MKTIELCEQFHRVYNVPVEPVPTIPAQDRRELRYKLLKEELEEFINASIQGNIVEVLDALCDLQVVLDGTFLEYGLGDYKEAAMKEVHRSNLSKLGEDGKPIIREDGKVMKGPNFFAPYLHAVLNGDIK